jgi:adenylate kinase family enzyme
VRVVAIFHSDYELLLRMQFLISILIKRLVVFENETHPLIEYYQAQNKCTTVLGVGEIDAISDNIFKALDA